MPSFRQEVIVLSATRYSMVDKETGELIEGTSVRYALTNNLLPYAEEDFKGYKLAKSKVDIIKFPDFVKVPGVYEADININISADGNAKATASNFVFLHDLNETAPVPGKPGK